MNGVETKTKKIERERDALVLQVSGAVKAVSLLRFSGADTFMGLIEEWIKYIEQTLLKLDPLDKNFQLNYSAGKEMRDFLSARLGGLRDADETLLQFQKLLRQKESELTKTVQTAKKAEENRF